MNIESSGDYNVSINYQIQAKIVDFGGVGDCLNNGQPYLQSNNNLAGLNSGTYHKSILQSDGQTNSGTTVIFKGEQEVVLLPEFEVEGNSSLEVLIEDCPDIETLRDMELYRSRRNNPIINTKSIKAYDDFISIQGTGELSFRFNNLIEQQLTITSMNKNGNTIKDYSHEEKIKVGYYQESLSIEGLPCGIYFLKIDVYPDTNYHRILIKN